MPTNTFQGAASLLATIPYFQGLEPSLLREIAQAVLPRDYDAGQLVLLEGEPAAGLYIVHEGWLKVSKIALDGREQILQLLGEGETFNAVSVFAGALNPATVTALEPSRVWLIRREVMLDLLDAHPPLARLVIQDLAGRVQHLISLVEDLSLRTVEARLARLLLEKASGDALQRQPWATQNEMASRLGTVPDVVSRTLRRMVERGLVQIDRREIRILDRAGLEAIAQVEP